MTMIWGWTEGDSGMEWYEKWRGKSVFIVGVEVVNPLGETAFSIVF